MINFWNGISGHLERLLPGLPIKVAPRKYQEHNGGTENMMGGRKSRKSRKEAPRV